MSNTKWTPGQLLNSAAEVIDALRDEQKVRRNAWHPQAYVHIVDGNLVNADGEQGTANILHADDAHIYTPPKRTREVTVWVNVVKDSDHCHVFNSQSDAKEAAASWEGFNKPGSRIKGPEFEAVAVPVTFTVEY